MKTITKMFILGLLLFPMCVFAQKATEQRSYEIRVEWEDLQGYAERVSYNVPIYYDDDDNVIKHGPFKINHKNDLSTRAQGNKCIITFNASGNYVNGKLDGILSIEESAIIKQGTLVTKGTLNFVNGVPTGTWKFSESVISGSQSESVSCTITIKDGQLVSYNDGKNKFEINEDNTFSATIEGDVYKKCVNTSEFIRKTGERTKPDENALSLINAFIAGTMSESDLIAKGFVFDKSSKWLYYFDYDNLSYYLSKLETGHFMDDKAVPVSFSSISHSTRTNSVVPPLHTLKRVNVMSAEELISKASTIKNAKDVSVGTDEVYWNESYNVWYRYYKNLNALNISGQLYYFTDEAKLKFEEAIKTALEEKQLEQERIAEEKRLEQERIAEERRLEQERIAEARRLQEIEKQRKQIQPICDYLVAQKTPLNICYSEEVGRYFDPAGLSDTWNLDLDKAIKPFCKIAGCTLVNFENGVAVLDITKFNKKGNITYRVPVTIKDGKILVTSISFSNATVVK